MARERNYDYYRRNYQYQDTALHTNYNYARGNVFDKHHNVKQALAELHNAELSLEHLKNKERTIYQLFGATTFEGFRDKLTQIFGSHSQDAQILRRCGNYEISKYIQQLKSNHERTEKEETVKYTLVVDTSQINMTLDQMVENINKALAGNTNVRVEQSGMNSISMTPNLSVLKAVFNQLTKQITKRTYQVKSHYSTALREMIKDVDIDWSSVLTFVDDKQHTLDRKEVSDLVKFLPFPWGYTPNEIKEAAKDPERLQQIKDAVTALRDELLQYLGYSQGSPEMQKAIDITLNERLQGGLLIFMGGGNWENNLKGALGEFGAALFFNYVALITGGNVTTTARVVGTKKTDEGESQKVDVEFLKGIGCQVKNYNPYGDLIHNIEVNQHPAGLSEYFGETQSLGSFLANYYFNPTQHKRDYYQFRTLQKELQKDYKGELLRLAIADINNDIHDTVTFYFVSGEYFVPGSVILEYYIKEVKSLELIIECSSEAPSYPKDEDPTKGASRGPNSYWVKIGNEWAPTALNEERFNKYLTKWISLRAYMKNFPLESYSILPQNL